MPYTRNLLKALRQRFKRQSTKTFSPTPTSQHANSSSAIPDQPVEAPAKPLDINTSDLNRSDEHVDALATSLDRALALHSALEIGATLLNGVSAWLPMVGATLELAKQGIEIVQASKALKNSATTYISHILHLIETIQHKLRQAEETGHPLPHRDILYFRQFEKLLAIGLRKLNKITQRSAKAWVSLDSDDGEFRDLHRDIEAFVGWLSLKSAFDTEQASRELARQMAIDRQESQKWAEEMLSSQHTMKEMMTDLGDQMSELTTRTLPSEINSYRDDIASLRHSQSRRGAFTDNNIVTSHLSIFDPTDAVIHWRGHLDDEYVWRAARIESLLLLHKHYETGSLSGTLVNRIMTDMKRDLDQEFKDACPPNHAVFERIPKDNTASSGYNKRSFASEKSAVARGSTSQARAEFGVLQLAWSEEYKRCAW